MADGAPVIRMEHIHKSFGGVHALNDVRIEVNAGEVHAILGENGAGKSTLIKTMTGVHQPDSGEIYWHGEPVAFSGPREAQQQGIGAIYQEPSLFPDLDIAENIMAGRQPTRAGRVDWRPASCWNGLAWGSIRARRRATSASRSSRRWKLPAPFLSTPNCSSWTSPPPH